MCLDTVDKEIKKTKGYGWKVFIKRRGRLYSPVYRGKALKVNKWIKDPSRRRIYAFPQEVKYKPGFHIFATRASARWFYRALGNLIRKVFYEDVVATGWQNRRHKVIVARKIFIEDK